MRNSIQEFSILPIAYEKKLDIEYGITLKNIKNRSISEELDKKEIFDWEKRVDIYNQIQKTSILDLISKKNSVIAKDITKNIKFWNIKSLPNKNIEDIINKYYSIPNFSSMFIQDDDDLKKHIDLIYRTLYCSYIVGLSDFTSPNYPHYCCKEASISTTLNLINIGYVNATAFYNNKKNHGYVGIPFVFGKKLEPGFIIADPTSYQLFNKNGPKNYIFITSNDSWDYYTDWKNRSNLNMTKKDDAKFMTIGTLLDNNYKAVYDKKDINYYFNNVFKTQVELYINR